MTHLELVGLFAIAATTSHLAEALWCYWRTGTTKEKALSKKLKTLEEQRIKYLKREKEAEVQMLRKECQSLHREIKKQEEEAREAEDALTKLIEKMQ